MISNIVSFLVSCLVTKIFAHIKNPYYRLFITEEVAHALCQIIKNDKIVDEIEEKGNHEHSFAPFTWLGFRAALFMKGEGQHFYPGLIGKIVGVLHQLWLPKNVSKCPFFDAVIKVHMQWLKWFLSLQIKINTILYLFFWIHKKSIFLLLFTKFIKFWFFLELIISIFLPFYVSFLNEFLWILHVE